jgi:hypothetical protein
MTHASDKQGNRILWPTHKAKAAARKALKTRIKRNNKRGNK